MVEGTGCTSLAAGWYGKCCKSHTNEEMCGVWFACSGVSTLVLSDLL